MRLAFSQALSNEEVEAIHHASLDVLKNTGTIVQSADLRETLRSAGASLDGETVKFPPHLLERAAQSAPEKIQLHSRNGAGALEIGNGDTRAVSGFDGTFIHDFESGKRIPITRSQVGTFAYLADQLDGIEIVGVQGIPQDVPQEKAEVIAVAELLKNTGKHILIAPDTAQSCGLAYEIIAAAVESDAIGNAPVVSCHVSPSAPLRWTSKACDILELTVDLGVPAFILPSPMAGATSPVTLAGHMVLHNAEMLSGIAIAQTLVEGHPTVYCNPQTLFNMREGNPIIGAPETMLLRIAGAQMARFYRMPSHSIGFDTDAHVLDQQSSWEKALTAVSAVQAGIDVVVNLGMFSTGLSVSYESMLLDHEVFCLLRRFVRGIEVSREHLGVEVINRIGTWGSFLAEDHTLRHFRDENWYPDISCRRLFESWQENGSLDTLAVAQNRIKELLGRKRPVYHDSKALRRIDEMVT